MKEPAPVLVIMTLLGLIAGFLIGRGSCPAATTIQLPLPSNYDPARAVYADTLKESQAAQERCWQYVIAEIEKRVTCEHKTTH